MSSSRSNHQLNLPPGLLTNGSRDGAARTDRSEPISSANQALEDERTIRSPRGDERTDRSQAIALAGHLFDEALKGARIENKEVAILLGVSESLVRRWRSVNYTERPSFVQLLQLPFSFHLSMHKAQNKHFGFGRHALANLIEAVGLLAAVNE